MNIHLIYPCDDENEWKNTKSVFVFPPLGLACLKSVTPPEHTITIIDETIQSITVDDEPDLVGLSLVTASANRGYQIADQFRKRGVAVVLGGTHVTLCPEEAQQHADAIVKGEGENAWPLLLNDLENNRMQTCYETPPIDLATVPIPDHSLFTNKKYRIKQTVMATRGCPLGCSFCSTSLLFGKNYRVRPIPDVISEIKQFPRRLFIFLDDNLFFKPNYAKELMVALAPLKKRWLAQATFTIADDQELLFLAKKAGCMAVLIGLESVSAENFKELGKPVKSIGNYRRAIKEIHQKGILIQGSFIFGFDGDTPEIFRQTIDFVKEIGIDGANFCTLTPTPGTPIFKKFDDEKRLITKNWSKYTRQKVVFRPKTITPQQLAEGRLWAYKQFYSFRSMIRRVPFQYPHFFWFWLYNLSFRIGFSRSSKADEFLTH